MTDEPPEPKPLSVSVQLRRMMQDAEGLPLPARLQELAEQMAREDWEPAPEPEQTPDDTESPAG